MKDRVAKYPGRVLVTPENGASAYYATLKRADIPTIEGDAINKQNLLPDVVAEKLGLNPLTNPVPADAFDIIADKIYRERITSFEVRETATSATIVSTFRDSTKETTIVTFTPDGIATNVNVNGVNIPVTWTEA